jgi:predicted N-acetyltransferase YhbS
LWDLPATTRPHAAFSARRACIPDKQGKGIGLALFSATLQTMKTLGHAYAFIGDAGPVDFYAKAAGAIEIPAKDKGVYQGMLRAKRP